MTPKKVINDETTIEISGPIAVWISGVLIAAFSSISAFHGSYLKNIISSEVSGVNRQIAAYHSVPIERTGSTTNTQNVYPPPAPTKHPPRPAGVVDVSDIAFYEGLTSRAIRSRIDGEGGSYNYAGKSYPASKIGSKWFIDLDSVLD